MYFYFQETYPSSPPVWFAESEETSVTNAVQILSNTNGRDNHVINQVMFVEQFFQKSFIISIAFPVYRLEFYYANFVVYITFLYHPIWIIWQYRSNYRQQMHHPFTRKIIKSKRSNPIQMKLKIQ